MAGLVYHSGALGDFITALPAIACFRDLEPRLLLLGKPAHGALCRHLFDEVWDAGGAPASGLFSPQGSAGAPLADRLASMTSALVFTAASSPLPAALGRHGVRDILRQDPFPDSSIPIVDYHLALFPGHPRANDRVPIVPVSPVDDAPTGIALAFGSGSPVKNWPVERFQQLASLLEARGEVVWWIEGPAESGTCPAPADRTWRSLALDELARRLSRCRLFVGNDSGVAHLAAAVGCPTLALFGPSDHRTWAPRGRSVSVIASPGGRMTDITVEEVYRVSWELLERG
jgi:heptosyltransferase-3